MSRDLKLTERPIGTREQRPIEPIVDFSLKECLDHFNETINLINSIFDYARRLNDSGDQESCKNIYRSQIVYLEGALDFYIHELSKHRIAKMYSNEIAKTEKYKNMLIPMSIVEIGLKYNTTSVWFVDYMVNQKFCREVYLSYTIMVEQLNLLGINLKDILKSNFCSIDCRGNSRNDGINNGKSIITELFERRNKIVHQMDRSHANASQLDIDEIYVREQIENIEKLVNAIHNVASRSEQS